MSGKRSYWHVYNRMRRHYIATGLMPERVNLLAEFADLEPADVDEGIAEFELSIGLRKRGAEPDGKAKTETD
ncbi:hypothetical protein GCM10010912_30060 [Paenibacillus albidus]|uniref:Uncharacterized protein n=1 Tax=Paenibacillus albidus TaxID=2041023 RepID=A0A917FI09_9BACL|nr:hypothetical protein [Paenibacillus albidus]GGF82941.1 hypothetical protein GCM10010912_30060 [Paenibacillus albidus]